MFLHEIELSVTDIEKSKSFYNDLLGLPIYIDKENLVVFSSIPKRLDINISQHFQQKTSLSFLTKDLNTLIDKLNKQKFKYSGPHGTHLGMQEIVLEDPDKNRVAIHSPGGSSPEWLKLMTNEY
ncbi:MAG TPA: VOC family protein [Segetibacter sp.]|jgi:catechol 2,3-dioxygenase-like lactoylglutathione lyase family enzyme